MSTNAPSTAMTPAPHRPSDPWSSLLKPSLVFGTYSGALGLTIGSLGGVLRSAHPILFALFSSGQWFALGTTYWFSRSILLEAWTPHPPSFSPSSTSPFSSTPPPAPRTHEASTLSGALSGALVAAAFRGRRNILPATLMFGVLGYVGQVGYELLDSRHAEQATQREREGNAKGVWERVATRVGRSRWSPIKLLDEGEYKELMLAKLERVQAELAVVEEDIRCLERRREEEGATSESGNGAEKK